MEYELHYSHEYVAQVVSQKFGLDLESLSFLPTGANSWLYRAKSTAGNDVVVRIQQDPNFAAAVVCSYLDQKRFSWLPRLYFSHDREVWEFNDGYYYSVQEYIASGMPQLPSHLRLEKLGALLRELHKVQVPFDIRQRIARESFYPRFHLEAKQAIHAIQSQSSKNSPHITQIQSVLSQNEERIHQLFDRSLELGEQLKEGDHLLVLTHGDVNFYGNVLESMDDRLYLVDWDWTMLSLPEHDFMYFDNSEIAYIAKGYGQDIPVNSLSLHYYRVILMLRCLWFWPTKALNSVETTELSRAAKVIEDLFNDSPYMNRAFGK